MPAAIYSTNFRSRTLGVPPYTGKARLPGRTETRLELLFFEDLPLGGEWTTRRRTITESDLSAFSGLSGDFNPLHSDAEYARATHFGGVIAQGSLISAIAIGLGAMDVPLTANMGQVGMSWKYVKPVRPGDTIGTRWRLNRKRNVDAEGWGLAVWQIDVLNQDGEVVATGEVARVVARRDAPKAEATAAAEAPARSRRRRGRRSAPAGAAAAESVMVEPVPEPAPADAPPPAARRRRGRRSSTAASAGEPAPAPPPLEAAAPSIATPSAAPRRRRRRRSGGGGGNGSGGQDAAPSEPDPAPAKPAAASGGRGLGGVLRRLRGG